MMIEGVGRAYRPGAYDLRIMASKKSSLMLRAGHELREDILELFFFTLGYALRGSESLIIGSMTRTCIFEARLQPHGGIWRDGASVRAS